jgi:hypothetical protein
MIRVVRTALTKALATIGCLDKLSHSPQFGHGDSPIPGKPTRRMSAWQTGHVVEHLDTGCLCPSDAAAEIVGYMYGISQRQKNGISVN